MKIFFSLSVFLCLLTCLHGQPVENANIVQQPPPVVFSVMLWGEEGARLFSYAPWDNHEDGNATLLEISATSGTISKKFAYYGKGTLRLLPADENPVEEALELESETNGTVEKAQKQVVGTCKLTRVPGQTKEYILLIAPQKEIDGISKSRIYAYPFDRGRIPPGSFRFFSQAASPLGVEFGQKKFALSPDKPSVVEQAKTEENARIIPLKVYSRNSGQWELALSQKWPHAKGLRGLVFLSQAASGVKVVRIADFLQPFDQAIGYGVKPTVIQPKGKQRHGL